MERRNDRTEQRNLRHQYHPSGRRWKRESLLTVAFHTMKNGRAPSSLVFLSRRLPTYSGNSFDSLMILSALRCALRSSVSARGAP